MMASKFVTFFHRLCSLLGVTEKNTVPVMVRMPALMHSNLRLLADYKDIELPVLVRRAAEALIQCYLETGDLPTHFKLVPAEVERPVLLVAESQSTYEHGPTKGASPPGKKPVKSRRHRGAGPAASLSKSA